MEKSCENVNWNVIKAYKINKLPYSQILPATHVALLVSYFCKNYSNIVQLFNEILQIYDLISYINMFLQSTR